MNYSNYRFNLDVQSTVSQVSLPVRLLDTGRRLYVNLTDGGSPYIIEDGCRAVFSARKADGNPVMNDCIIENNSIIRYDLTAQTTSYPGIVDCEMSLYDPDGKLITSPKFILVVDDRVVHDADFPVSESENGILDGMITSEVGRKSAEDGRVEAEKARVRAEASRETIFETLKQMATDTLEDATEAIEAVNMANIVNSVLETLPTWKGGSY